ncbi:hypothetical protein V8F20_008872 [Naviculisporaceae sp. PSN 640]
MNEINASCAGHDSDSAVWKWLESIEPPQFESDEDDDYRLYNLGCNHVIVLNPGVLIPEEVAARVSTIITPKAEREDLPDLAVLQNWIRFVVTLREEASDRSGLANVCYVYLFPNCIDAEDPVYGVDSGLEYVREYQLAPCLVPDNPIFPQYQISAPKANLLYGYTVPEGQPVPGSRSCFTPKQRATLSNISALLLSGCSSNAFLRFPFLTVQFEARYGGIQGAVNRGAGAAAACMKVVETLNTALDRLGQGEYKVDSITYSIALGIDVAYLFVMWKEGEFYMMQRVGEFSMLDGEDYLRLWHCIRNIQDWAINERLPQIRKALDKIAEEQERRRNCRATGR